MTQVKEEISSCELLLEKHTVRVAKAWWNTAKPLCKPADPKTNSSENIYYANILILLIQFVCLCPTSPSCFLEHWLHLKWRRRILGPRRQNVLFFLFCFDFFSWRLDQNQSGGVSKWWSSWKRNSIFELEIRHVHVWIAQRLDTTFLTTKQILHYHRGREHGWAW